jgi:hypothetical protein
MSKRKLGTRKIQDVYLKLILPKRREAVRREIFSILGILRNYAAYDGGHAGASARDLSSRHVVPRLDDILEELAKGEGVLAATFEECIMLLRMGKIDEMGRCFAGKIGAEDTEEFVALLTMWDSVNPAKLLGVIESQRNAMREEMTTTMMRNTERVSDFLYIPTIAAVLIIFTNFIYIGYYLQQKEMLTQIFY